MTVRTGIGIDVHAFAEGRPLRLGGFDVPFEKGLLGHSDGDVLIHAIIDAMLGAAGLGDIGVHFPSTTEAYHQIHSTVLLEKTVMMVNGQGWSIRFVDATIIAELPYLNPYVSQMRLSLSAATNLPVNTFNIKATTTDGLGFIGNREGIACLAVATIESIE